MQNMEKYLGRIVRLNHQAFREIVKRAKDQGEAIENCFLVAEVSKKMRKLVCYGASLRITVGVADVVLI